MIKIAHYEVYTDKGDGWRLEDRFAVEQRQEAFNLAKEREAENCKVKIIKEIFDVQDNSYQESVEYVSNLNRKKGNAGRNWSGVEDDEQKDAPIPEVETLLSRSSIPGALLKLVVLITVSLIFANLFVGFLFPLLEIFVPEENSRPVLFGVFFVVFLAMSVPLLLRSIPWYVFINRRQAAPIKEQKFYDKAEYLIKAYNLNSDKDPVVASAYPEAPLEYKQYVVSFLSEIISHIKSPTVLQNSFSRLGIKLLVYGGCLELARYCGLKLSEANSIMFDAFKITDGDKADLEAFYEAKRTYRDNQVAIFLTGVGAHLMAQVINGMPISERLLNLAFNKWEAQDSNPKADRLPADVEQKTELPPVTEVVPEPENLKDTLASLKSDLKFMDNAIPGQEETATAVSSQVRNIVSNLVNKYKGENVIEDNGITSVRFRQPADAIKFAIECLKDISAYKEELDNENLLMRNCCAVTRYQADEEPNLSSFLADMFEHIYNNEIVLTGDVRADLPQDAYQLDFLGEKNLKNLGIDKELYKLVE